jgi:hypothetical protein
MLNIKQLILNNVQYSGYKTEADSKYYLSASMLSKDDLQCYLSIVNGNQPSIDIDDAVFGTLIHIALENIVKNENIDGLLPEYRLSRTLNRDWKIHGTADLVHLNEKNKVIEIFDYKTTKNYTVKMFDQDPYKHSYTLQLNVLRWLFEYHYPDYDIHMYLSFFSKDANKVKGEPVYIEREVPTIDVNELLIEKTKRLQEYLENNEAPPKCEDVWTRKYKGMKYAVDAKCEYYCSFGKQTGLCPYYKEPNAHVAVSNITAGLDW